MSEKSPTGGGVGVAERRARSAFSRPPVVVFPDAAGIGSTVERIVFLSAKTDSYPFDNMSAAVPLTCGVAIDVPLIVLYAPPRIVERMFVPGAAKSTEPTP